MKKLIIFLGIFLFAKTFYVSKGWNLLGTDVDINVSNLDVPIIWKYNNGKWFYYSKTYKLNYPKIDKIYKNDGFWIYTNKNIIFTNKKILILPLYFYDLQKWEKVKNIINDEIIIINPSNGPGNTVDKNYESLIKSLSNNKVPIGYITSSYAHKNFNTLKKEIDKWINLYPDIKGFFIDEVSTDNYDYYQKIYEYIKKRNYLVILNPGTKVNLNYFNIADIIVVYEGENSKFSYYCNDFPQKSAIIIYNANETVMKKIINSKCRYIFVSDEINNNYSKLPTYFDEEIKLLK